MKILPNDFIYDIMIKCDNKTLMKWRLVSREHNKMAIHILAQRGITYDKLHKRYMGHPLYIHTHKYDYRYINDLEATIDKVNQIITRNIQYDDWNVCAEFAKECINSLLTSKISKFDPYPINDTFLLLAMINIPIRWLKVMTIFIKYPIQMNAPKYQKCYSKFFDIMIKMIDDERWSPTKFYTFNDFNNNGIITQQESDLISNELEYFKNTKFKFEKELKIEICKCGCRFQRKYSMPKVIL